MTLPFSYNYIREQVYIYLRLFTIY